MLVRINTSYDFTPTGKRRVAFVKDHNCIKGYVSGREYCRFPNMRLAIEWRDNTENLNPQPWDDMAYL